MNRKTPSRLFGPPLVLGVAGAIGRVATTGVSPGALEPMLQPAEDPALELGADAAIETVATDRPLDLAAELEARSKAAQTVTLRSEPAKRERKVKKDKSRRRDRPVLEPLAAKADPADEGLAAPRPERLPVWARLAYPAAIFLSLAWAGPLIAFCLAYQYHYGPFEYAPFPPIVFGSLAVLPAAFILLGAYVLRQAAKLGLETRRARTLAEDLAIPAALAVDQAGGAAEAVRREVSRATEAGVAAERQLLSLRQSLADESDRLLAATAAAERMARALTDNLSRERTNMSALSSSLELQIEAMNDTLVRQTQLVTETSDLAAAQLREAQAGLAARATDLAAAAGEAGEAAELAGEALTRQTDRLESVGEILGGRLQNLGDDLGRGHSRLAELAVRLQADQQALAERLDAQRLSAMATAAEAEDSVRAVAGGAEQAAATLRDLVAEAEARLRAVGAAVQDEQAALDARARASLSLFRDAVAEERTAIEAETRSAISDLTSSAEAARRTAIANLQDAEAAVAAQAEAARAQVEQLGEAAFAASQKADQAFDSRISSARRSIEQSAALVEEAGRQSVGRIDAGLSAAKAALGEVEAMLKSVDERVASVPAEMQSQAQAVRTAIEASLAEMSSNARKVAADAEALDTALQERVRRNYEMLSDALKTMGMVASVTEKAAAQSAVQSGVQSGAVQGGSLRTGYSQDATPQMTSPDSSPASRSFGARTLTPPTPPSIAAQAERPSPSTPAGASFSDRAIRVPSATTSGEPGLRPAALSASDAGLRPRLRLTAEQEMAAARSAPGAGSTSRSAGPAAARAERTPPVTHETLDPFVSARPAASTRQEPPRDTTAWTWKDLLSSIDEPPIDDEVLADRLISEIEALGLDAASLLPLSQIDAIAAAMQKGDGDAVRDAVRALAPGAVRRLSRRVLTDKVLRAQADRYVRRYEDLLNDSARRDREGFMTAALLGSEPGRAFLLFDAAVGELH